MPNPFRTLRFRLVLLNLAMFGTVIVLLGAVFLVAAERYLRREFDQRSIDGARVSLLVLARADAGLPLDSRTRVSINEVVTDAVERCHPYAQQREIRLEPALCAPTKELDEPEVEGDAQLLVSMVSNLVRNAIRHSPPGEAVEAAVERIEAEVRIAVRDRGPGIPGDQFPRLFERFYQAFGAERPTGSGLGLSIAQGVAKLHKGRIEVANRPGGGYAFEVMLPQA